MKKLMFVLLALTLTGVLFAQTDKDGITDIPEKNVYEKGGYPASDASGDTLAVKKGEGFDLDIPKIMITGEIDTKIMLHRETGMLEDIADIKDVLYEKDKVYMPDNSLKDEEVSPQKDEMKPERDFIGRIKIATGAYNNMLVDAAMGKAFDKSNSVVLRLFHDSRDNDKVNMQSNSNNLNSGYLFYGTALENIKAGITLKGDLNRYENPFPTNIFKNSYDFSKAGAAAEISTELFDTTVDVDFSYDYAAVTSGDYKTYTDKESRFTNKYLLERDFGQDSEKIKAVMAVSYRVGDSFNNGINNKNTYYIDMFLKGIMHLEPVILQAGLRWQDHTFIKNYYRVSPYLALNYDVLPQLSVYAEFKPEMREQDTDSLRLLAMPFMRVNPELKMPSENVNIKVGATLNILWFFVETYYRFCSVSDYAFYDETANTRTFGLVNADLDYSEMSVAVQILKLNEFSFGTEYKYTLPSKKDICNYMPEHSYKAKVSFDKDEWSFKASLTGNTAQLGKTSGLRILPAIALLDITASKKVSDFITLFVYANNLLNNTHYVLYYYKQTGINVGMGITLNF